jgi:hypothetical protein
MRKGLFSTAMAVLLLISAACIVSKEVRTESPRTNSASVNASPSMSNVRNESGSTEFEDMLDELDNLTSLCGSESLRKGKAGNVSLRIWVGFGPTLTRGLLLQKNERPTDQCFISTEDSAKRSGERSHRVSPTISIGEFWERVSNSPLLDLPDDSEVGSVEPQNDSDVVIVEVRRNNNYRSFKYSMPCKSPTKEAKTLISEIQAISGMLNVDFYKCS